MNLDDNFQKTFYAVLGDYNVWPPPREALMFHAELEHGHFDAFGMPNSTIRAVITQKNGKSTQVMTCPIIRGPELSLFILSVTWNFPSIDIHINNHHVATTDSAKIIEESIEWARLESTEQQTIFKDITAENEYWRAKRISELTSLPVRSDRLPATNDEPYIRLHEALKQLSDQTIAIRRGETYQDTALAARLRALICRAKRQYPLLQMCAGKLELPLILYSIPPSLPHHWDPNRDVSFSSSIELSINTHTSPIKTIATQVEMDLDYWLQEQAANLGSKPYTNNEILLAFANTEASHYDVGVEPLVRTLKSMKQNDSARTILHD